MNSHKVDLTEEEASFTKAAYSRASRNVTEYNWKPTYTKILIMVSRNTDLNKISKEVNLSRRRVEQIRNSEFFQRKLMIMTQKTVDLAAEQSVEHIHHAKEILNAKAVLAARKLVGMLNKRDLDPKERLRFDVARDILDRVGLKAVDIIETREKKYSPEEIMAMHATMLEIESITTRLNNQNSRFLISNTVGSPLTDESSDDQTPIQQE